MIVDPALALFHPLIQAWFNQRWQRPTSAQAKAWPLIAAGEHVLVSAPTGSGKTLTAFLWALNSFCTGACAPGATRVVYVSPLKALNNDVQRNLLEPLAQLQELAASRGEQLPAIRVSTRSGDTPQAERQRLLRKPPEILITTPESLNLMLSTRRGRQALATVQTLVLDEIHALAADRRGTHLATAVERLEWLAAGHQASEGKAASGDALQRISLSATVHPLALVAAFVGGLRRDGSPRPVTVVTAEQDKQLQLQVATNSAMLDAGDRGEAIWPSMAEAIRNRVTANKSTLVFANSRALTEKLTALINSQQQLAWSHHGSLSRELRTQVEQRLKAGRLPAIVATSSLEMGIDIGALDEVVLVQSPASVSAALQRIGRAGHQVGAISRAVLHPTHAGDALAAAVLAAAVADRDIEPVTPPQQPLDVLAQVLVSITASATWHLDDLYRQLVCAWPYRNLSRPLFDLVLQMLNGRYADSRVPALQPRLSVDPLRQTAVARRSAVLALYGSGGTIPDRGYYQLRHAGSGSRIGELDEEFVWEARPGQVFTLGAQSWQVQRISHNDVLVLPATGADNNQRPPPPFWRSEDLLRSWHLAERQASWLETADLALAAGQPERLQQQLDQLGFDQTTSHWLLDWLAQQRQHTGTALPHRHHVLVEHTTTAPGGHPGARNNNSHGQLVLHTQWGGRVNQPLALVLRALCQHLYGHSPEIHANDDAVALVPQQPLAAETLMDMLANLGGDATRLEQLLKASLEGSGYFGARFRECAGRALLLPRGQIGKRLPLWLSRQQAKSLMQQVRGYTDFPILLETWRSCLHDTFELAALQQCLTELADGRLPWQCIRTSRPSPFAAALHHDQINRLMYANDSPEATDQASALDPDWLRGAVFDASLRPSVPAAVVASFLLRRRRLAPGYAPAPGTETLEWVREQVLLSNGAWRQLEQAIQRDHQDHAGIEHQDLIWLRLGDQSWLLAIQDSVAVARLLAGASEPARKHQWQHLDGTAASLPDTLTDQRQALDLLAQWLPFQGPCSLARLGQRWPGDRAELQRLLLILADEQRAIQGTLVQGQPPGWCDADSMEALLRMTRAAARPDLPPQAMTQLPAFIHRWQDFGQGDCDAHLERLRLLPVTAPQLEQDWLPARLPNYLPGLLDQQLASGAWLWLGRGEGQLLLSLPEDLDLLAPPTQAAQLQLPDGLGRWPAASLLPAHGAALRDRLAADAWAGWISADSLEVVRRQKLANTGNSTPGAADSNQPQPGVPAAQASRRHNRRRQRPLGMDLPGYWFAVPWPEAGNPADALTRMDLNRERARVLLDRHGVLCRDLVQREADDFIWRDIFQALRLMELAGEVQAGLYFADLSGPQFALPGAWQLLQDLAQHPDPDPDPGSTSWWLAATDPASPCGLGMRWPGALKLPARRDGNYLVLQQGRLLATLEAKGKRLAFAQQPEAAEVKPAFAALDHLLQRAVHPLARVVVTEINGQPARGSAWLVRLREHFNVHADHRSVVLERRIP